MAEFDAVSGLGPTLEVALTQVAEALDAVPLCYGHGTDNAGDEAVYLVCALLDLDFAELPLAQCLTLEQWARVQSALRERIDARRPVAYITGRAWFAGYEWTCDERVLIPRSPLAELIENGFSPWQRPEQIHRVLDLCCGSGCLGLAAALYLPTAAVDLVDIDADALAVAECNVQRHGLAQRTQLYQGDLFQALPQRRYEVIISNPPYVDAADMADLPAEYLHEPSVALAAGQDGLDLAHRILAEAARYLTPDGVLIMEVGNSAPALEQAYPTLPFVWLEFARGGHGVCLLHAVDLPR